ncbi:LuxR C-terminal-related transcriptional regulator [Sphingopyxis sp. MSC1_008]|jgi:DNA-binding CsgD family transcriptional regulator|uniref:LuxR C-terminal-related transcriptional regulator n=1 Tax=Sphingopyxis sp. MSC1_008 TaxID=2909265 RepID=UPI0020C1215F|nr:LuxR C-terminal-related transcriptional regulator [Sphingopyxis sp. MSC1_008]
MQSALTEMIGAIGEDGFMAATAESLRMAIGFDLAAAVLHRADARAELLFDGFAPAGFGQGLANYVHHTHGMSPMVHPVPMLGAVRASDFAIDGGSRTDTYLVWTSDEEMGFRTLGWPERCEEIGLYIAAWSGVVELSFYRERARASLSSGELQALGELSGAVAAAFERHRRFSRPAPANEHLSARECEVYELMVAGCSSEAIALRLGISRHTVKDHRKQIFRRLRVGSLAELFARSHRAN